MLMISFDWSTIVASFLACQAFEDFHNSVNAGEQLLFYRYGWQRRGLDFSAQGRTDHLRTHYRHWAHQRHAGRHLPRPPHPRHLRRMDHHALGLLPLWIHRLLHCQNNGHSPRQKQTDEGLSLDPLQGWLLLCEGVCLYHVAQLHLPPHHLLPDHLLADTRTIGLLFFLDWPMCCCLHVRHCPSHQDFAHWRGNPGIWDHKHHSLRNIPSLGTYHKPSRPKGGASWRWPLETLRNTIHGLCNSGLPDPEPHKESK